MPAIIFVFDGVIVDSEPVHEAALRAAVREVGVDFSHHEFEERFLGFGDREIVENLWKDRGRQPTEAEFAHLAARKWFYIEQAIRAGEIRPYAATVNLLREVAAKFPMAICSGALRHEIEAILTQLGVRELVKTITTADDTPRSKPDPAPYLLTVKRLGVPAGQCVTIEDTSKGIASAKGAGVKVVGVCHSMPVGRLRQADLVVGSSAELTIELLLSLIEPDRVA
jgi:beta-phosphoglucomutase